MKLRNQLVLAFLLLSVVPLVTIVLYGYYSAEAALALAARQQSAEVAGELRGRLSEIRQRLEGWTHLDAEHLLADDGRVLRQSLQVVPGVEGWQFAPSPGLIVPGPDASQGEADGQTFVYILEAPPAAPEPPAPTADSTAPPGPPRPSLRLPRDAPEAVEEVADEAGDPEDSRAQAARVEALLQREFAQTVLAARDVALGQVMEHLGQALEEQQGDGSPELVRTLASMAQSWEINREVQRELQRQNEQVREVLGIDFEVEVKDEGRVVGVLRPSIQAKKLIESLLRGTRRAPGDLPFAVDVEGRVYATQDDRPKLEALGLLDDEGHLRADLEQVPPEYVLSTVVDEPSGLTVGILRPTGEAIAGLRRNAALNFAFGLGVVALALFGILPLSGRLTRSLSELALGADKLAEGDLQVRVPVRSGNELGNLARAFNHMAFELSENQRRLLDGERRQKEQEIHQRLLEAENDRKTQELEEARRFQLALLPRQLPRLPHLSIAVHTKTAAEVGGDYYDFLLQGGGDQDGVLTAVIGDATGHGARAGTMVAVIKSLFTAHAGISEPPEFLSRASATIKGMGLDRMAMALTLLRFDGYHLTAACAGMPPLLLYRRASGTIEEVALPGMPLGALLDFQYRAWQAKLEPGDTVLLMSDGFPERVDVDGDVMGYERAREIFGTVAEQEPEAIVAALDRAASEWAGGHPLEDDMTFVVFQLE